MTDSDVIRVWLVDGVVRHVEPAGVDAQGWVAERAESAVDDLGAVPMVAVAEIPVAGGEAAVRPVDPIRGVGTSGSVAKAINPALERAMATRPGRTNPLTIDAPAVVLLAVRLRSRGTRAEIASTAAALASAPIPALRSIVDSLQQDGMLRTRGEAERISLTPAGTARLGSWMAESTDQVGRDRVEETYREFLPVNRDFLSAVSAWQTGARSDSGAAVITLRSLVARITPTLGSLSEMLPRFICYRPRFDRALGRSEGRPEWLDSPVRDSVHTVWFELHEHLLAALGRSRAEER